MRVLVFLFILAVSTAGCTVNVSMDHTDGRPADAIDDKRPNASTITTTIPST